MPRRPRMLIEGGLYRGHNRAGELAQRLRKHTDAVSRWVNPGALLCAENAELAAARTELDRKLSRKALQRLREGGPH